MGNINVETDVVLLHLLDHIGISILILAEERRLAAVDTRVGDHVGNRVGLNNNGIVELRVLVHGGHDAINHLPVPLHTAVVECELAVGGLGAAVTVGHVVDDHGEDYGAAQLLGLLDSSLQSRLERDVRVERRIPVEGGCRLGNLLGLPGVGLVTRLAERLDGRRHIGRIAGLDELETAVENIHARDAVAALRKDDGGRGREDGHKGSEELHGGDDGGSEG